MCNAQRGDKAMNRKSYVTRKKHVYIHTDTRSNKRQKGSNQNVSILKDVKKKKKNYKLRSNV